MDGQEQNEQSDPLDDFSTESQDRTDASRPVTGAQERPAEAQRREAASGSIGALRGTAAWPNGRRSSAQEDECADLLVSELYRWQAALDVPIEELLAEPVDSLSPRVMMRASLLKVMKTAMAFVAKPAAKRSVAWGAC